MGGLRLRSRPAPSTALDVQENLVKPSDQAQAEHVVAVAMGEFACLRDEINGFRASSRIYTNLNLTTAAAITGFVLSHHASPLILLVLPAISSALGIGVMGNALRQRAVGKYIQGTLRPLVAEYVNEPRILGWEAYFRSFERRIGSRILPLSMSMGLLFPATAIVALIWVIPHLGQGWTWIGWSVDAGLLLTQLAAWSWAAYLTTRRDP
jgi:hypothetical protein